MREEGEEKVLVEDEDEIQMVWRVKWRIDMWDCCQGFADLRVCLFSSLRKAFPIKIIVF